MFWRELQILRDDVCERLLHGGAGEGRVTECHLVQQNAKGPKVNGSRRAAAIDNFGRHIPAQRVNNGVQRCNLMRKETVLGSANEAPALGGGAQGCGGDCRGQVEVGEADVATDGWKER